MDYELYQEFSFSTPVLMLDKFEDHAVHFEEDVKAVRMFCELFDYYLKREESFILQEVEGRYPLCEVGYTFRVSCQVPSSKLRIVTAAISVFTAHHGYEIDDEHLAIVKKGSKDDH